MDSPHRIPEAVVHHHLRTSKGARTRREQACSRFRSLDTVAQLVDIGPLAAPVRTEEEPTCHYLMPWDDTEAYYREAEDHTPKAHTNTDHHGAEDAHRCALVSLHLAALRTWRVM
jgi:hypothetical protein